MHVYTSATNVITCAKFHLKQIWQLTKAMPKMKHKEWSRDKTGVIIQSWLLVPVELMACSSVGKNI